MTYPKQRAFIAIEQEEQISHYSLSPLYRDMKRGKLAEKIQREVTWRGKTPELEVLEKKITDYRNTCVWLEDNPWSLGESIKPQYGIPGDATGILLELWKYSLEIGYPLTLRHAKWIARLYKVIVTANDEVNHWKQIQILFFTALRYADRERVSQALKQSQFDTRDEDVNLVTPVANTQILQAAGILPLPRLEMPENAEEIEKKMTIKRSVRENLYHMSSLTNDVRAGDFDVVIIVHYLHYPRALDELPDPEDNKLSKKFFRSWIDIQDMVRSLSIEQERAYAILVTCFSKGSKWDDLSPQDFLEIIGKFAQLASQRTKLREILHPVIFGERSAFAPYYRKVGLIPPIDNVMKTILGPAERETGDSEVKYERQHKAKRQE